MGLSIEKVRTSASETQLLEHGVVQQARSGGTSTRVVLPLHQITSIRTGYQRNDWLLGVALAFGMLASGMAVYLIAAGADSAQLVVLASLAAISLGSLAGYALWRRAHLIVRTATDEVSVAASSAAWKEVAEFGQAIEWLLAGQEVAPDAEGHVGPTAPPGPLT